MTLDTALAIKVTHFWVTVDQGSPDDCWPWLGYIDQDGYGGFFFNGKMRRSHELALTFTTGEVRAEELDTCHSCNNPPCCNPRHLRFDTRASNVADAIAAGTMRGKTGKLTADDVSVIKARLAHGARQQDLADQFGVTNGLISMIKHGKRHAA